MKRIKNQLFLCLSVSCFLLAFLLSMLQLRKNDEALAARLAPNVIRFHVLANSDSPRDQELKLEVRSLLLDVISENLGEDSSLEETRDYIRKHLKELENAAEAYMREKGFDYAAFAELTNCYFPTKIYGDMVFPSGKYEALRISLGRGDGKNWWCVLYPALCFTEPARAHVPEESREKLRTVIPGEDYRELENERRLRWSKERPRIRLWTVEALQK